MPKLAGVDYRLIKMGAGIVALSAIVAFAGPHGGFEASSLARITTVNLGFLPNVTHAPALVGVHEGTFQKALGTTAKLNIKVLNAGPEAMEALLAGALDVLYVGPSPALNTFLKTGGNALRIVSGVCEGGASLVSTRRSGIRGLSDLAGKRVAVPQLGNTQDVSLRHFMAKVGLEPKDRGGSVDIIPVQNADTVTLFKRGEIDAAWVPEPWASRLVAEAGANRVLDERTLWPENRFPTTVLVARSQFMVAHPDIVQELVQANSDTIDWMLKNAEAAHKSVNQELYELAGNHNENQAPDESWGFLTFTCDLDLRALSSEATAAFGCGYLKSEPREVAAIYDPLFLKASSTRVAR